jgi:predicted ArsR family transcriptional regulator
MSEDIGGLKFVASMFKMAIKEIDNIMGQESLSTIFRLMGESVGENVAKRISAKTPDEFAAKMKNDVLEPALGAGGAEITANGNEITVVLKVCPFEKAGIDISNKFYCTYTEGLVETAAKNSLGEINFVSEKLRAVDKCDCSFKIKLG